jgi:hypothetical protein
MSPLLALGAGTVSNLSGTLSVQRSDGSVGLLSEKSQVKEGDVISTERDSYALIRFPDGGQITLRPRTQVKLEQFQFDKEKPAADGFVMSLIRGGLRTVTGLVGKRGNRDAFRMSTATATIGIRGTDFTAIDNPPPPPGQSLPAGSPNPGVYVSVAEGTVAFRSGGVDALVGSGQTGFSATQNAPPQVIPPPPNLPQVAPPRSFEGAKVLAVVGASGATAVCE